MSDLTAEQQERETALYAARRIFMGDDAYGAGDLIGAAEYIRAGVRGLPMVEDPPTRQWAVFDETHTFPRAFVNGAVTSRPYRGETSGEEFTVAGAPGSGDARDRPLAAEGVAP